MSKSPFPYRLLSGSRAKSGVAFALVHPIQRIDVPHSAIRSIAASDASPFPWVATGPDPHVALCLRSDIREHLVRFTRVLMHRTEDERAIEIWVGKTCVIKPVVRECLGSLPTFFISTNRLADAKALADRLGAGWRRPQLRLVVS